MATTEVTFPDQVRLECLNRHEALAVYEDCQAYFRHGIRLGPGATVIDAGAHIGVFAGIVAARLHGEITIHAFEPMPQSAALLRANAARLAPARIFVHECALGDSTGTREFAWHLETPMLSSAYPEESAGEYLKLRETLIRNSSGREVPPRLKVLGMMPVFLRRWMLDQTLRRHFRFERVSCPVRRLADVLLAESIERIDLLKVNVEKSEELVLEGIGDCWPMVRQAVIEVHDIGGRLRATVDRLREQGFATVNVEQSDLLRGSEVHLVYALR
jgi:FkbM family methyltransferase